MNFAIGNILSSSNDRDGGWSHIRERLATQDEARSRELNALLAAEDEAGARERRRKHQGAGHHNTAIDETGNRYGMLSVLKRVPHRGRAAWFCRCDCGRTRIAEGQALRSGDVWNCGQDRHGRRGGTVPKKRS